MNSFKTTQKYVFAIVLGLALAACTHMLPPAGVENATIPNGLTMDQIKQAMIEAGNVRGWEITEISPGKLEAVYKVREHVVRNEIHHNQSSYSIKYKDSKNMRYDNEKDVIHNRYNSWTNNLNADIQNKLSLLQ